MTNFSTTVDIQAPRERVWDVLLDVARWPEWTPTTSRVERLDAGPFTVGSRARIFQPKLRPAVWQVTELNQAAGSFTWVTRSAGVLVTARHRVEENGGGCRVTLSLDFSGVLAWLAARTAGGMMERYIAAEANGLRARSEA